MRVMRAWGYAECRILPTSMPGRQRSSVYLPAPVVLPAASTMAMGFPIIEKSVMVLACHQFKCLSQDQTGATVRREHLENLQALFSHFVYQFVLPGRWFMTGWQLV